MIFTEEHKIWCPIKEPRTAECLKVRVLLYCKSIGGDCENCLHGVQYTRYSMRKSAEVGLTEEIKCTSC